LEKIEKREKKIRDLGENHHEAPKAHFWVENLLRPPKSEIKKEK